MENKVLDVRGTHGSGKSTLVRKILETYEAKAVTENGEHLGYYAAAIDCGVIARYTETGGGCDGIKTADEVVRRVKLFHSRYRTTVFEGVLVSHTFSRYARLADELGRENYWFLFLNTPLETCISRVERRRRAKGNLKSLDPKNVIKDHKCDWEVLRPRFKDAGYNVGILDWHNPWASLEKYLG